MNEPVEAEFRHGLERFMDRLGVGLLSELFIRDVLVGDGHHDVPNRMADGVWAAVEAYYEHHGLTWPGTQAAES